MTTLRAFVDNLEAVTITGVTHQFTQGPPAASPGTADLPASYVRLPNTVEMPYTFGSSGGWPELRASLVILLEPVVQDQQGANFDATVDMIDNVATAFRVLSCGTLGLAQFNWTAVQAVDEVAGTAFWAVVVDVEGRG